MRIKSKDYEDIKNIFRPAQVYLSEKYGLEDIAEAVDHQLERHQ